MGKLRNIIEGLGVTKHPPTVVVSVLFLSGVVVLLFVLVPFVWKLAMIQVLFAILSALAVARLIFYFMEDV